MAATTYGTKDIYAWTLFAHAVRAVGPVRVYGVNLKDGYFYNHPPLIGFMLWGLNGLSHLGVELNFSIRTLSSACDVLTSILVFELVRVRRSLRDATEAGILVAASPVLFGVSGFHGNTDPIFVMFTLLSLWLLADRGRPALAGCMFAIAVSVKIVPFVILPAILVYAFRRRCLRSFLTAFAILFVAIWSWPVFTEWSRVSSHVFGYPGISAWPWGIPQFASWAGIKSAGAQLSQHGRSFITVACALVAGFAVYRRPHLVAESATLAIAGLLLLSPAFGVQYLVWALAFAYLVDVRRATAYNFLAGVLLIEVYSRWSGGILWDHAYSTPLTESERIYLVGVWLVLLVIVIQAFRVAFDVSSRATSRVEVRDQPTQPTPGL